MQCLLLLLNLCVLYIFVIAKNAYGVVLKTKCVVRVRRAIRRIRKQHFFIYFLLFHSLQLIDKQ